MQVETIVVFEFLNRNKTFSVCQISQNIKNSSGLNERADELTLTLTLTLCWLDG